MIIERERERSNYLAIMGEAFEINGPTGEEKNQDVKRDEGAEDNGGVDEVEAGKNRGKPRAVENSEGPNVKAPGPSLLPQQIDLVHDLAADVETRHRIIAVMRELGFCDANEGF